MTTIDSYLDALASHAPTPGGGSAAAHVAAHGAALVAMAARITGQSPRYTAVHALASIFTTQADELRVKLRQAAAIDETAYDAVRQALSLPKNSEDEKTLRAAGREIALQAAALAPLVIAECCAQVSVLAEAALTLENPHLLSDLLCAAEFALAGANAAAANVLVNHAMLADRAIADAQQARLLKAVTQTDAACAAVRARFSNQLNPQATG